VRIHTCLACLVHYLVEQHLILSVLLGLQEVAYHLQLCIEARFIM